MERRKEAVGVHTRGARDSTFYVVAYDIPDDKRRTKVHRILKGFGKWTEFSLFECFLTRKEVLIMRAKLDKYLDASRDRVRIYTICENCLGKIDTLGIPVPVEETSYLI
jgi:CRISPR-associated protein Cas2